VVLGLELGTFTLSHSISPFLWWGFSWWGSLELFAWGWLQTVILLNSASWVARITGVSHQYPAWRSISWHLLVSLKSHNNMLSDIGSPRMF
jgi:hypothetical protein